MSNCSTTVLCSALLFAMIAACVPEGVAPTSSEPADTPADQNPAAATPFDPGYLVAEGAQVEPQTLLHLDARKGACGEGAKTFKWTVLQPDGSHGVFMPNSQVANPTFEVNVAGDYHFAVQAYDEEGVPCPDASMAAVSVIPSTGLHVELTWSTPGDSDESDEGPEAGADLDLHFYTLGADEPEAAWFHGIHDCYWFNPEPNWGDLNPSAEDDPSLDRDDTDGAGPEIVSLNMATGDKAFGVMVHGWSSHGYGDSFATVRIYELGILIYESEPVALSDLDAWDVGVYTWSTGAFVPSVGQGGQPKITKGLKNPFIIAP